MHVSCTCLSFLCKNYEFVEIIALHMSHRNALNLFKMSYILNRYGSSESRIRYYIIYISDDVEMNMDSYTEIILRKFIGGIEMINSTCLLVRCCFCKVINTCKNNQSLISLILPKL